MGKRHRAQNPADPSLAVSNSSADHLSPPSLPPGKHENRPHITAPSKYTDVELDNGVSADYPHSRRDSQHNKKKKEMKKSKANLGALNKTINPNQLSDFVTKVSVPLLKNSFEDRQGGKRNGVKRKAAKFSGHVGPKADGGSLREAPNSDLPRKKKKKRERAFHNWTKNAEGSALTQLTSDAERSGSPPSSVPVTTPSEKGEAAEPAGLEIYWKLSSNDASVREAAALALIRELQAAQEAFEEAGEDDQNEADHVLLGARRDSDGLEECAPGVRYALRRLVRGVGSSHEGARQGFALALTMVLGVLTCVKGVAVMRIIEKNLDITSSGKGQEVRDALLGRLFAYGAMVRSRRLFRDANGCDEELLKEVTEQLLTLAQKKSFLREPAVCVLLELADQLPLDSLENSICSVPAFKDWMKVGPESGGADVLFLALKLWQKLPIAISKECPLVPSSKNSWELFDDNHISSILPYLGEASCCHPRVHSVWPVLFQVLLPASIKSASTSHSEEQKKPRKSKKGHESKVLHSDISEGVFPRFWRIVVEGHLLASSHARKHLALNLLMLVLPWLPPSYIPVVLSKNVVRCLLDVLSSKDTLLFNCVQLCMQSLSKWAENDNERLMSLAISLQKGSAGKFDALSKTQTVKSLIGQIMNDAGLQSLVHSLEDMFCSVKLEVDSSVIVCKNEGVSVKADSGEQEIEGQENAMSEINVLANRLWILDLMYSICKQAQLDVVQKIALQIEVGKFIFCQILCDSGILDKVAPQKLCKVVKWPLHPTSKPLHDMCVARLLRLLVENQQLLEVQKGNRKQSDGREERLQKFKELGFSLFELYQELRNLQPLSVATSQSEDEAEVISKLTTAVLDISSALRTVDDKRFDKLRTMRLLLVQMVLESLLKPGLDTDIASELLLCCKYAFGDLLKLSLGDIEGNNEGKPAVIDVIVDLVVSLLGNSSAALRGAAEQVFKSFSGDFTDSSLSGMLQVIMKQPLSARHKLNNPFVDDDDDDDLLDLEDDASDEDEEQDSSSENIEDNSDDLPLNGGHDTDTHKEENSDAHKDADRGGLQDGMDSDSSDLPDLDDDAMFRMDSHVAQMFKQKKKGIGDGNVDMKDADTQLLELKFRVLALLEIFLQKHVTSPLVLDIVPPFLQAFFVAATIENTQLADRVANILQKKVLKAKYYPKCPDVDLETLHDTLETMWRLAARSANRKVGSLAQACWIWMLKVIHGTFAAEADVAILEAVSNALEDYFYEKKSCLTASFFVDTFTRQNWIGKHVFTNLIGGCIVGRSEFHRSEAMRLAGLVLGPKSRMLRDPSSFIEGWRDMAEPLEIEVDSIAGVITTVFQEPFKKASRQTQAVEICMLFYEFLSLLYPTTLGERFEYGPLLWALENYKLPDKGKLRSLVSEFRCRLDAVIAASQNSDGSIEAVNVDGFLGGSTQRTELPAGEKVKGSAEPKKKQKRSRRESQGEM